ncbi:thiamine diphosphokinase [Paenibacillus sp. NPDC058071]|uniref:thiamine diphosphokinase n=1 Tax=Paenibacillus sp. NPDC058071 TaxID=3346326 RepID=UPI0036DD4862
MTNRVVIFTGGSLDDWALAHIRPDDKLIGADRGASFLIEHGLITDLAIGDFDSVTPQQMEQIRQISRETLDCDPIDKNYTDTELAFHHALELRPDEIVLIGALGSRFDHTLANVQLLALAVEHNIPAYIFDEHNAIQLAVGPAAVTVEKKDYSHMSLLPFSSRVTGIYLHGFQYPLNDATLQTGQSLGISNVIAEQTGIVEWREGQLLIIRSKD